MTTETTNSEASASESALSHALTLDEAADLDIHDPDEDNVETDEEQVSDEASDEVETDQEAEDPDPAEDDDETEDEDEGTAEEADKPEPEDGVTVTVNGEKITLSDLKAGYMRQADYSRKTQTIANEKRDLEALSARVTGSVNAIAEFLAKQIPEAPDPSLAMTNPGEYVQKQALHNQAVQQVQALLQQAENVKDVGNKLTDKQRAALLEEENAKLTEAFPVIATNEGRKKFFDNVSVAAHELGFSDKDLNSVTDHRLFKLAHYAALGLRAERAQAKAKQKAEGKPPVAPQKRQQQGVNRQAKNRDAMKRLARTGSIEDALLVDFD